MNLLKMFKPVSKIYVSEEESSEPPKKTPLKWKHLIPENPTHEEFREAWKLLFEAYPENCRVRLSEDHQNAGFSVETPIGFHFHGGFGFHTEEPDVEEKDLYYIGYGITWGHDNIGTRYYKINPSTGLPQEFEKVKSIGIVINFLRNHLQKEKYFIEYKW